MTEPFYRIEHDRARDVLQMTLTGLWTPETAQAFGRAFRAAASAARTARGGPLVLSDARAFPVQTRAVSDIMATIDPPGPDAARRTAIVVGGALSKMQATRTLPGDRFGVFTDIDEARAWLISE